MLFRSAVEQLEQDEESEDEEKRPQECRDHHELAFARLGAERQHGRVVEVVSRKAPRFQSREAASEPDSERDRNQMPTMRTAMAARP